MTAPPPPASPSPSPDSILTDDTRSLVVLFDPLPDVITIPTGRASVALIDIETGSQLLSVRTGTRDQKEPDEKNLQLSPAHLDATAGPCFDLPPIGLDLVATWLGWVPPAVSHPCPTGRAFLPAVECAAGIEPDVPVAQRLIADGDSTGLLVVGPGLDSDVGGLCDWSVELAIRVGSPLEIAAEGAVHAPDCSALEGFDVGSWMVRRAALEAAQAVCRNSPQVCPAPRLRRAPDRTGEVPHAR